MMPLCLEQKEELRLAALHATNLLDTPPELEFERLVELAAHVCGTPIGLFTLVDRNRQWFKAAHGLALKETGRPLSFCSHAIEQPDMLVVEDATKDPRFAKSVLVTGEPRVRFYAGLPLENMGHRLGTVCVIDLVPRKISDRQRSGLQTIAAQVKAQVELRLLQQQLDKAKHAQQELAAKLRSSDQRFHTFMNHAPFVSYLKNEEGKLLFYNQKLAERFGVGSEEWLGKSDFDIWPKEIAKTHREHDLHAMRTGGVVEHLEETRDARQLHTWKTYKFSWRDELGRIMLGGISVNLTEELARQNALEEAILQLERLATRDALTGLANRRFLDQRVEQDFQLSRRNKTSFSVLLLDLDDFKQRNDLLGHACGDELLERMGRLIAASLRSTDLAARYGGEEFVVLLPGADQAGARLFAERIRAAMHAERWPGGALTASFGTATLDAKTGSGQLLMALADQAMYAAKRTGKDQIVSHAEAL